MAIIDIINVSKSFKGNILFNNISTSFEKGCIYGIIGKNGSGKSVLFKMICGFIQPDSGEITIHPNYRNKDGFPKSFGIIIDRPGYISGKTGFENLKMLAGIQGLISDIEIKETMRRVGLDPDTKQKVKQYSLGMKQKLAIAQAIMENQEILILDEPFNALDSESIENIRRILLDFKKEGKTIIMTSHNQEDIALLSDYVLKVEDKSLRALTL